MKPYPDVQPPISTISSRSVTEYFSEQWLKTCAHSHLVSSKVCAYFARVVESIACYPTRE